MKTNYPIETIDLRHQPNDLTPKKSQLFLEYSADPENGKFYILLIRRREREFISDGNKLIEVKVFQIKILNFKDFNKKCNLKIDTMIEFQLQKIFNYPIYPRETKTNSG